MKKRRKKIIVLLSVLFLFTNSLSISAQELVQSTINQSYVHSIINVLNENGEINQTDIQSADVVTLHSSSSNLARTNATDTKDASSIDAVQITSKDEDGIHQLLVFPFIEEDSEISNVTRSKAATSDNFEYSDVIYVLVSVTYYYYNSSETNFYGPFYRPTLVSCQWRNGTQNCSVSCIHTLFRNAGYVCDLTTGNHNSNIYEKVSEVYVENPTQGITYVGTNITMDSSTGLSMLFNGIDTYSYAYTTIVFSYNNSTVTRYLSSPTFTSSGLAEG